MAKNPKKPGARETSARDRCPKCGEPGEANARLVVCVTCGGEGFDSYCMSGGVGTECTDCESGADDDDD